MPGESLMKLFQDWTVRSKLAMTNLLPKLCSIGFSKSIPACELASIRRCHHNELAHSATTRGGVCCYADMLFPQSLTPRQKFAETGLAKRGTGEDVHLGQLRCQRWAVHIASVVLGHNASHSCGHLPQLSLPLPIHLGHQGIWHRDDWLLLWRLCFLISGGVGAPGGGPRRLLHPPAFHYLVGLAQLLLPNL